MPEVENIATDTPSGDLDEGGPYRILVVDDEPDVLESLTMALRFDRGLDCEVEGAKTAEEALERARQDEFDLVLADYRMPGMNGAELLARFHKEAPGTRRALITGYVDVDIAMEAMEKAEIHYYIQKPWDNEDLRLTVREALEAS